jgi:hypothetical protein
MNPSVIVSVSGFNSRRGRYGALSSHISTTKKESETLEIAGTQGRKQDAVRRVGKLFMEFFCLYKSRRSGSRVESAQEGGMFR